jgi:hypothetical protein
MVLAGLAPPEWKISIVDENLGTPDYTAMPQADLMGIVATPQTADQLGGQFLIQEQSSAEP